MEDDAALRDLLTDFLHAEHYAVMACADGSEAMEEARVWWPCLALVDLAMPGMDGPTFIAACRADADLRELPVLVATGGGSSVPALPVQGFVPKPFDLADLLSTIVATTDQSPREDFLDAGAGRITYGPPSV